MFFVGDILLPYYFGLDAKVPVGKVLVKIERKYLERKKNGMNSEQPYQEFGIANQVKIIEGEGGFPIVEVSNEEGSAKISVYSAQVLSFLPVGESEDVLFVSEKAYFQAGKATKGGIPICWPWFGPDPEGLGRASHGFVRNRMWTLLSTEAVSAGETKVRLGITADEETKAIWPKSFELVLEVLVGAQLSVSFDYSKYGGMSRLKLLRLFIPISILVILGR